MVYIFIYIYTWKKEINKSSLYIVLHSASRTANSTAAEGWAPNAAYFIIVAAFGASQPV